MTNLKNVPLTELDKVPECEFDFFLEDEVKFGFYIPAIVKQLWAAEIKVLSYIDAVCKKYEINYFVDAGTMLGAVRHGGFIPWDDDLDITMLREDYEKFLAVYEEHPEDFPKGMEVRNYKNREDYNDFHSVVVGLGRISFEPEHLTTYYGFPYIVAIDIFVLDKKSDSIEKQKDLIRNILFTFAVSDEVESGKMRDSASINTNLGIIRKFPGAGFVPPYTNQTSAEMKKLFYSIVDRMIVSSGSKGSGDVVKIIPGGIKNPQRGSNEELYKHVTLLPFEYTLVPVVEDYSNVLKYEYGNYWNVRKGCAGHDYPCFSEQERQFKSTLDFEIPEFRFERETLTRIDEERKNNKNNSWKAIAQECLQKMEELIENIDLSLNNDDVALNEILNYIADCQQLAIDLGYFLESVKGEGLLIIGKIEQFCERIFILYNLTQETPDGKNKEILSQIHFIFKEIKNEADLMINRKEYLFIVFKDTGIEALEKQIEKGCGEADISIMIQPYHHKTFDGQIKDTCIDNACYQRIIDYISQKSYARLVQPEEYDIALNHPEKLYFQFPYDNWNPVMTVDEAFYAENLATNTDELIYIPWFKTDDFGVSDVDYLNCKYYVCMPGVTYSDRVVLDSEKLREVYIRRLTEFAGMSTENIWEGKICVEERIEVTPSKTETSKSLLFCLDFETLLRIKKNGIDFLKERIEILSKNEGLNVAVYIDVSEKNIREEYFDILIFTKNLLKQSTSEKHIWIINDELIPETAAEAYDAYYGASGKYAVCFAKNKKPTMIF